MKKDLAVIFGLFFVIIVLVIFGKGYTTGGLIGGGQLQSSTQSAVPNASKVKIKNLALNVETADTKDERKKGLSKRNSLALDSGMLFVFEDSGLYAIWMKDMKFAIDIIWINENKTIIDIKENAPPEPGRNDDELTVYRPAEAAKYILEINAGLIKLNDIKVGDEVSF